MATIKENLKRAIEEEDIPNLSRIVDRLRFKLGYDYATVKAAAERAVGRDISFAEWDELMQRCDYEAGCWKGE